MRTYTRYLTLIILIIGTVLTSSAQFRYGPTVAGTFTNLNFKQDLVTVKGTAGFQAGVQAEMMFPGIGFGLDMGLIYNMAGAKVNLGERLMWSSQGYGNEHMTLHQIMIPFHLRFKYTNLNGAEDIAAPFIYAGPDFNITVAHNKCDAMTFAGGDLGVTAGLGVELFHNWQISGSYTWGMTYTMKAKVLQEFSARNRGWAIRLTRFF